MKIDFKEVMGDGGKLPEYPEFEKGIRRAPKRVAKLSAAQ